MTNDYQHTYHGDAADYAAELADYYKQQQETAAYLINDYKAHRDIIGDEEADSQIASIRARLSALNSAVQLANTDAKYWSQFENEADYSAAMFDEKMYEQHGQSDYQALSQTVKDNETTIQTAMDPYVVNAASAQNDWLEDQAASIATADDYRILKKETEDEYSAVSELYNEHDTSAENMEIYNQMQALEQKLDDIDAIITEKKKQEYYTEMAVELYELPEQLRSDVLNIPYLMDEKIELGYGMGDAETDTASDQINFQIAGIKKDLKELGYSNKEINGFIIHAELLHDKDTYEKVMAEKQAYAEEHPLDASLASVLENFFGMLEPVDSLRQKLRNAIRGEYIPTNDYSVVKQHTDGADVTRDTVAGKIEESTGSELLSKLYEKGMSTADIVAQTLATGGASSLGSLGKGLIAVAKSFGDDFLRTFIKTYGDDAVRAIAAYGDDAAKLALNNADDATKLLLSSGDDLSKTALSYGDDIGKSLASTGDKMIDDWYGLVDDTVDGAASSWDDVANALDDVADDALAGKPNTGYNGSATEGAGKLGKITDGGNITRFTYNHNPSNNPKVLADAVEDPKAIYGYRPNKEGSLKAFADGDWSNPDFVEGLRQDRISYHNRNEVGVLELISKMRNQGYTDDQVVRAVVEYRNQSRLSSYLDAKGNVIDQEGYAQALAHCKTYEQLRAEGKTNEAIIKSATRGNPGMDASTGLYDDYCDQYTGEK